MRKEKLPDANCTYRSREKSKDWTGESICYYIRNKKTKIITAFELDGVRGYAKPLDNYGKRYQFTICGYPFPNPDKVDDSHDTSFIVRGINLDFDPEKPSEE